MECDIKRTGTIMAIVLALVVLAAAPVTMADGKKPSLINAKRSHLRVGTIDRIGTDDIVINDTWFRLSDNISISGFKKGDFVSFVATDKREIKKIDHTRRIDRKKKRKK